MLWRNLYILFLFGMCSAATYINYNMSEKPKELAHLPGCYIEEIKNVIPYGDEITEPGKCVRISCKERYVDYATCGVANIDPPCYLVKDESLQYPECCGHIQCEDNNV